MALIRDEMEPLAREIAHFLVLTGATAGSRWYYHGGYKRGEDLIPHKQSKNDEVWYSREKLGRSNSPVQYFGTGTRP